MGIRADVAVGQTGDFEVTLDGKPLFSKRALNRFPNPGEVEGLAEQLLKKK